jgi:hypothetical protein
MVDPDLGNSLTEGAGNYLTELRPRWGILWRLTPVHTNDECRLGSGLLVTISASKRGPSEKASGQQIPIRAFWLNGRRRVVAIYLATKAVRDIEGEHRTATIQTVSERVDLEPDSATSALKAAAIKGHLTPSPQDGTLYQGPRGEGPPRLAFGELAPAQLEPTGGRGHNLNKRRRNPKL